MMSLGCLWHPQVEGVVAVGCVEVALWRDQAWELLTRGIIPGGGRGTEQERKEVSSDTEISRRMRQQGDHWL